MGKKYFSKKFLGVMVLAGAMLLPSNSAFAYDRGKARHTEIVTVGRQRYSYHDGRFFKPGWFWFNIALVHPLIGAVVTSLPAASTTIVIGNTTYYRYNETYYKHCPGGYIVVDKPAARNNIAVLPELPGERVNINIPNSNGSYTTVTLIKQREGYLGPQGEYYPGNPTLAQLRSLYGR